VDGDPVRLAQVFTNLLHNAAKYTDRGGHIELRAEQRDDTIVVIVRDDGIGIPPEMLPRIFEVFVQVDQGPDRARGGLGLGLTLVRNLVEMHGGGVQARSDGVGRGSEFELALPVLSGCAALVADAAAKGANGEIAGAGAGHPAAPGAGSRPRPLRIVVVDDNADIRDSLKALLEFHGHAVEGADDGQSGIDMIRARNPEVAVVDIGLPGMDGYQVARALRGSCASTRLVAMTGYGRPEDRQLALEAGFDAHLVKPVDFEDLTRVLQQITER
jgi:CheY-like chemotaxis protein